MSLNTNVYCRQHTDAIILSAPRDIGLRMRGGEDEDLQRLSDKIYAIDIVLPGQEQRPTRSFRHSDISRFSEVSGIYARQAAADSDIFLHSKTLHPD